MSKSKNELHEDGFIILESSMNKDFHEEFEVVESSFSFSNRDFSRQIQDEMEYYGIGLDALSKSTYISRFRLSALINRNATFEPHEITLIRKRLHF